METRASRFLAWKPLASFQLRLDFASLTAFIFPDVAPVYAIALCFSGSEGEWGWNRRDWCALYGRRKGWQRQTDATTLGVVSGSRKEIVGRRGKKRRGFLTTPVCGCVCLAILRACNVLVAVSAQPTSSSGAIIKDECLLR
ncbi:hypothetical protein MRX96_036880 [Rhipicephalus microplus]